MIHVFRRAGAAGVALLCIALAGCGGGDNPGPPAVSGEVKIGLLAPLTGGNVEAGHDAQRGAELAGRLINAGEAWSGYSDGRIWGPSGRARLSIVTLDTKSDRQRAADGAATLVSGDGVVGLVGAFGADATLDASQRAERLQTPFVSGDAAFTALTERGLSWFFRAGPDAADYGGAFLSLLRNAEQPGQEHRRVAVLYSNDATGTDLSSIVTEYGEEAGYQIVANAPYEPGDADPSAAVAAVRAAAPDVVLMTANLGAGERIGKAFQASGYTPPAVVVYGAPAEAARLAAIPGFAGRVSRQVSWSLPITRANPLAAAVTERYQHDFGAPMTAEAASAFTAVTIFARAIEDAGSSEREQIRSALVAIDLPGDATIMPWNGVRFDGTHQNTLSATAVEQDTDGTFATVYPRDLATTTVNWPPPGSPAPATGASAGSGTRAASTGARNG
ncbi:ABC transporter substrate-binding protein [Frankia sp. QA3]|uniref:ABC transporter substrate-binding protein n=1 Tax=Frankia sp. QA3 TaxID=710111 RepID=UPI000269C2E2|nr:ABC transporter substrate-binding protein [Frankia sp. QA3]EIV91156.1 ABC-type branched-chain amino acid transport system, periplasmic component [Frankia sp. QA3]